MKLEKAVLQNPLAEVQTVGIETVVSGSNDFYRADSLESFSSARGLTYTHEDAHGLLDYPTSFQAANYWFKDAGVQVWGYEETYLSTLGTLNIHFDKAKVENTSLLNESEAIKIAQAFINDLDLNKDINLTLGNIRHKFTCGGTLETPSVIETVVQFRQNYQGVKSINSDHGLIAICIDNDGRIVNVYDSTKLVLGETDKRALKKSSLANPKGDARETIDTQFEKKLNKIVIWNPQIEFLDSKPRFG